MTTEECYKKTAELAVQLVAECSARGVKIATAESCTGGMISGAVTAVSGSSAVIELGVCSYSNRIKREVLGVSAETLEKYTEYSIQCAAEMAEGARRLSGADYGVSTTGVAGPTGGSEQHPVGEVCIAVSGGEIRSERFLFTGNREQVRAQAALTALELLLKAINDT
ncbi:MAG: CinA family protein [Oscillospiraceae bacterium]